MNWRNVLYLLRVERKSGRLIRGIKATRYRENKIIAYWPYWVAAIIGIIGGFGANAIASAAYSTGIPKGLQPLNTEALGFYSVLPTVVLGISIVFSLFQQIQLAGKASSQVMYWLPVTWQEHTLASILADLLGLPAAVVAGLSTGLLVFSAYNGLILQGLLTIVVLFASAFLASSLTEIVRILQVRSTGAVYKSSGKAAIWVRFVSTLLYLAIFYVIYFYVINQTGTFIAALTAVQNTAWYVPFVWLPLILSYVTRGMILQGLLFTALSAALIAGLYYLAVELNKRFGLYEPPAITLQKGGVYSVKTGLLGRIGFSSVEAALIRKDLRAFTRRQELLSIYIFPIIIVIVGIFNSLGISNGGASASANPFWVGYMFLVPASTMAIWLGQIMIGEEGQVIWRISSSPVSGRNLVRSKYFFIILFSVIVLAITSGIGVGFYQATLRKTIVSIVESFLMVLPVAAVSLQIGLKYPDFSSTRRARMVRQEWSLVGFILCAVVAAGVIAPVLVPYGIGLFTNSSASNLTYAVGVAISAAISAVLTVIFYRINVGSANELLRKGDN